MKNRRSGTSQLYITFLSRTKGYGVQVWKLGKSSEGSNGYPRMSEGP